MFKNAVEAIEYILCEDEEIEQKKSLKEALLIVERALAEDPCEYGQLLGEFYTISENVRDIEKAYFCYYIGLSQCEYKYSVGFKDSNDSPPDYCGPIGDFRNESMVSDLVSELGFDKIKLIDKNAREWLDRHNLQYIEFINE